MAKVIGLYGPQPPAAVMAVSLPLRAVMSRNHFVGTVVLAHQEWAYARAKGKRHEIAEAQRVLCVAIAQARADATTAAEYGPALKAVADQLIDDAIGLLPH